MGHLQGVPADHPNYTMAWGAVMAQAESKRDYKAHCDATAKIMEKPGNKYHPEYNLHEMARLLHCRREKLIRLGFFRAMEDADRLIHELEALHADAGREDIAWQLGLDRDLLDEEYRTLEVRNWLTHMVSSRL